MKIQKAVIPAAGLGTRFLPATKTVPKEMLPIVDKPILLYIVEEIVAAGIPEIVLIAGRGKTAIEDFFDTSYEVEDLLKKTNRLELLEPLRQLRKQVTVISVRQQEPLGLGHAVLCAEPVVGRQPFAVLLGDEIMVPKPGGPTGIEQLCRAFESTGVSTVAVMEVADSEVSKYGIIDAKPNGANRWIVNGVVEKPTVKDAPSRLALPGRYVFDGELFQCLRDVKPGRNNEIQLTDGMAMLAARKGMHAMTLNADRFDAGDKLGFLQANVELALKHPEIGPAFHAYLKRRFGG